MANGSEDRIRSKNKLKAKGKKEKRKEKKKKKKRTQVKRFLTVNGRNKIWRDEKEGIQF